MRKNNHVISDDAIKGIRSAHDDDALKLASEAENGVNPFYHAIGTMGGISVRDKYSSIEAMKKS